MSKQKSNPASSETNPVGHADPSLPDLQKGIHSASHLYASYTGTDVLSKREMSNHVWIIVGAGLGQVFPDNAPMQDAKGVEFSQEEQDALQQFAAARDNPKMMAAPDWSRLIKIVLPLILRLLVCVVLLLSVSVASAAMQAPRPPQAPPVRDDGDPFQVAKVAKTKAIPIPICKCSKACECGCKEGRDNCNCIQSAPAATVDPFQAAPSVSVPMQMTVPSYQPMQMRFSTGACVGGR